MIGCCVVQTTAFEDVGKQNEVIESLAHCTGKFGKGYLEFIIFETFVFILFNG
jgi:hypothetical protein